MRHPVLEARLINKQASAIGMSKNGAKISATKTAVFTIRGDKDAAIQTMSVSLSLSSAGQFVSRRTAGTLSLSAASIPAEGTDALTAAAISASRGGLSTEGVSFEQPTRTTESAGGVVGLTVQATQGLTMNSVQFINSECSGSDRRGSLVCIHLAATPSTYKLTSATFSTTSAHTHTHPEQTRNIHISCDDATLFVNSAISDFTGTIDSFNGALVDLYWVKERISTGGQAPTRTLFDTSLRYFLFSPASDGTLYLSPVGADLTTCGWAALPCKTIHRTVPQSSKGNTPTLTLVSVEDTHN